MTELMYSINSGLIAVVLLLSMLVAMEIGVRIGLRAKPHTNGPIKEHVNAIQGSILGILALLLAFTLSLSLQRFDTRSEAVVSEANAIGTTYLRAQLLKPPLRAEVQALLREYVDLRLRASNTPSADGAERDALLADATHTQNALWARAMQSAEVDPSLLTSGLFIQALNELIDSLGRRDAAVHRHVPEAVLLLLYGTFLMAGGIVGYACGVGGHRPSFASYVMVVLIVVLVFIIVDLDRPRRGLIQVSQKSLLDLQASMRAPAIGVRR
jgi:hypothetical protein